MALCTGPPLLTRPPDPRRVSGILGAMTAHSPIVSPESLSRALDRPDRPRRGRPLGPELARGRAGSPTRPATSPERSSSTSTRTSPRPRGRAAIPSPPRRRSASGSRRPGSARTTRSSPTTTPAERRRPGCGGCWTTSVTSASRSSTAAIPAWVAAGYPVSTADPQPRPRGHLALRDAWTRVTDREAVAAGLGSIVLLDARAEPRYRGEVEPVDRVPGHIPTARSAPVGELPRPGWAVARRRGPEDRFATLGVDETNAASVVTSCGSGVTACLTSLAMRMAGLPDPILYPGSYSTGQIRPADRHRPRAGRPTRPDLVAPAEHPDHAAIAGRPRVPGRRPVRTESGPRERCVVSRVDSVVIGRRAVR